MFHSQMTYHDVSGAVDLMRAMSPDEYLHPLCFTIIHCTVIHLCICFILYFTCMEPRLVSFLLNEYVMLYCAD